MAEVDSVARLQRAARARPHRDIEVRAGDLVYCYRRLKLRDNVRKGRWCGPGVCLLCKGTTCWVSARGRLWKCSRGQ
eukprot:497889-Alexandrium_andersonii.AAC.1